MGSMQVDWNYDPKTLVQALDEKAKLEGSHPYMRYPPKDWETKGYETLTWTDFANAVNKVAFWLDEQLGKSKDLDTVTYLGPADPRYAILELAVMKTGRKLLIPDGRLTSEGLQSLLEKTKCVAWIYADDDKNNLPTYLPDSLKVCALPTLEWILSNSSSKAYPYNKTYEEAKFDEVIIIHTSGTTGIPKPIYHTHGLYAAMGSAPALSRKHWPRGIVYDTWMGKTVLSPCPQQWLGGLFATILAPIYMDTIIVMTPSDIVGLPLDVFKKILQLNKVDGILCPPHTINQLYGHSDTRTKLKKLRFITFAGAALDRSVGDDLCEHTKLTCIIGSTETGDRVNLMPADKKLWYAHSYVPENEHSMVLVPGSGAASDGSEDLYELILQRPKEGGESLFQPAFWNPAFKGVDRIETAELYAPVKDKDGETRWRFAARKDDLTKLNWLAKFKAHDIEVKIQQHPDIQSVFVGGEGRPAPYVIVEPKEGIFDRKSAEKLLSELYEGVIACSNKSDIDEIRIPKETVLIAKKEKPFKRNAKQVVLRKEVEKDYLEEIEAAYINLENSKAGVTV